MSTIASHSPLLLYLGNR